MRRTTTKRSNRGLSLLCITIVGFIFLLLSSCATPTVLPTPTPTRTPSPTPTITPSPTPTPAFPVTVGCSPELPEHVCATFQKSATQDPVHFRWSDQADIADIQLRQGAQPNARDLGTWSYVVVAPFFTAQDDVILADLKATWSTTPTGTLEGHPLMVSSDTLRVFTGLWGTPAASVQTAVPEAMLAEAEAHNAWVILPFQALNPQWKVLRVDGISLLEKGSDLATYPLQLHITLGSQTRPETLDLLSLDPTAYTNYVESEMTVVAMTGVTAMTRATAQLMDAKGVTYPAQDIKHWFADADFVHISNEVSFKPDCVAEGSGTMSFCSHDSYIALLEEINTNIIELTGNHLEDKGTEWVDHTLEMYRQRGWQWFGGGVNQAEATRPLTVTHGSNRIAFVGCNAIGPFAGEESGGAARCNYEQMRTDIRQLKETGYQPIVTIQYLETYEYFPTPQQVRDFRYLAEAGAVMVQGSQAHQAQTFEFHGDTFIHYGLGNFFFDQMWSDGTRQEFVVRLNFYQGRLLSIDLRTAILEEYGRPRPMTVGDPEPAADRQKFLEMLFELRP